MGCCKTTEILLSMPQRDHRGDRCTRSRMCGTDGCQNTHNELLHGQLLTRNEATLYRQHQEPERGPVADISQSQTMGPILAQRGATVPSTEGSNSSWLNDNHCGSNLTRAATLCGFANCVSGIEEWGSKVSKNGGECFVG